MKKNIAILGSTGSIGKILLNIVKKNNSFFKIILLTANKDHKTLYSQAKKFGVKNLIITNYESYKILKKKCKNKKINIYNNYNCFNKIFTKKVDYTMNSIVGFAGLKPTLEIIKFTKQIAIANKESIICGWNLIKKKTILNKTKIIPIDSEHYSIWSSLNEFNIKNSINLNKSIQNLFITASGGPFRNTSLKNFKNIKINQAIKHPTWKMGKKISIDSATLVNKMFEVIEAQRLFNIDINKISIKIHPQSYIHSIIQFRNGLIKICAHEPNMLIPIANSLDKNLNFTNKCQTNFKILNNLNFTDVDKKKFPVVKILKTYPKHCSLFDTALVSINDELVNLFLQKKISFKDIFNNLLYMLNLKSINKLKNKVPKNYKEISEINDFVRLKTHKLSICSN
ncbi:1-deoxy-D-xylulose 5-phosphate reductoisomerase [Candidatus Pelagibacter communis]|uniref:1-deoxy-D-xylulose 5-phosphate reductoisomerase n=1 Tax=Pelagibacter ubique TaxID=198252 RepID=UPI00092CF216|nr:1-deoxy-D-xylulose 5-phosphate reductoisomerase [Candidatus Pelagibacter ubique]